MRLITRSDFDGLACGTLLLEAGVIDHWKFVHPKDLQDGLIEIDENDCLANVPYVEGCGLWFDHHSSEFERNELAGKYKGESRITPSCARIIYEYYGGEERFSHFNDMMVAVDKVDSGNLTIDEIQNPEGWILVGLLMDPRTGLGRWRNFTIPNYRLMEVLMEAIRTMSTEEVLALPDVVERIEVYHEQAAKFKEMVKAHTRVEGDVIISDLRGVDPIYSGN
ncbi:MAG: exopolyphosphatase, partial [Lachnospiraceae bacterium]|nr:exopolyphosphatase [Lachnospiraceae bacterium]